MSAILSFAEQEAIVRKERAVRRKEISSMQAEKDFMLRNAPANNAALLIANIVMAGLFFLVSTFKAGSLLPEGFEWAKYLVGAVTAGGASCLMYATNAVAFKLPGIRDAKSKAMMWGAWLSMLSISAITSAAIALLLVNGAASELSKAQAKMERAALLTTAEAETVSALEIELASMLEAARQTRTERAQAQDRQGRAQAAFAAWRQETIDTFGQGSEAANRRLLYPSHPEHAVHLDAIADARQAVERSSADLLRLERQIDTVRADLHDARAHKRAALERTRDSAVEEASPWDDTMGDMVRMFDIIGVTFDDADQFSAVFAVFFALVLTLSPPFWSYHVGAEATDEIAAASQLIAERDDLTRRMRQDGAPTPSSAAPAAPHGSVEASGDGAAETVAPLTPTAPVSSGSDGGVLPCGLPAERFEKLQRVHFDKATALRFDAANGHLEKAGEIHLKAKYGGSDEVAKMLKHLLVVEGYGEYGPDGSVRLFNAA